MKNVTVGRVTGAAEFASLRGMSPGMPATVSASFTGTTMHFTFGIPRGTTGEKGDKGDQGEVTNAALASALATAVAGTSNNTNGVALLNLTVSDPPTQAEMQTIADKLDELILAQRRQESVETVPF